MWGPKVAGPAQPTAFPAQTKPPSRPKAMLHFRRPPPKPSWILSMTARSSSSRTPLPRRWPSRVQLAILHTIRVAYFTLVYMPVSLVYMPVWAFHEVISRSYLRTKLRRVRRETVLLREELRIKTALLAQLETEAPSSSVTHSGRGAGGRASIPGSVRSASTAPSP